VVMAAMINALKVVGKNKEDVKVIVNGAGAAGIAVTKLLVRYGISSKNVILCDSKGTIYSGREDLENNKYKKELAEITNSCKVQGNLSDAIKGADVFLGVSKKGLLKKEMVESMNKDAIVLAMANPDPEIMPDEAKEAGARVIATGRSDFPNQVNNVLGFPGIFRGALDVRATRITEKMKVAAAEALASIVESPSEENIIPYALDKSVVPKVAEAVKQAWLSEN
ncbi:NAD-dependent malic enzyme, partial [Candidatus Peregrinibacteria bacterium]|nr:NAD-dependent malic enzyme [Candidatus Peregrinibacteria bacterium]